MDSASKVCTNWLGWQWFHDQLNYPSFHDWLHYKRSHDTYTILAKFEGRLQYQCWHNRSNYSWISQVNALLLSFALGAQSIFYFTTQLHQFEEHQYLYCAWVSRSIDKIGLAFSWKCNLYFLNHVETRRKHTLLVHHAYKYVDITLGFDLELIWPCYLEPSIVSAIN